MVWAVSSNGRPSRLSSTIVPPTSARRDGHLDRRWRPRGVHDEVEAPLRVHILDRPGAEPDRERDPLRVHVCHDDLGAVTQQGEAHEQTLGPDADDQRRGGNRRAEPAERRLDHRHRLDADEVLGATGRDPPRVPVGTTSCSARAPGRFMPDRLAVRAR